MAFNYRRGFQMVIHDPRLNNPHTTPPTPLVAPPAFNVWTVSQTGHSAAHIFGWAAQVAAGVPGGRGLDAVHIMAHGNQSFVQLGTDNVNAANAARLFGLLAGKTRWLVFWSCLVGSDERGWYRGHPRYFGQAVAQAARCNVVMAQQNQTYSWNSANVIDFGDWEGPIDVFQPNGDWSTYQDYNPFRATARLVLEPLIFR